MTFPLLSTLFLIAPLLTPCVLLYRKIWLSFSFSAPPLKQTTETVAFLYRITCASVSWVMPFAQRSMQRFMYNCWCFLSLCHRAATLPLRLWQLPINHPSLWLSVSVSVVSVRSIIDTDFSVAVAVVSWWCIDKCSKLQINLLFPSLLLFIIFVCLLFS